MAALRGGHPVFLRKVSGWPDPRPAKMNGWAGEYGEKLRWAREALQRPAEECAFGLRPRFDGWQYSTRQHRVDQALLGLFSALAEMERDRIKKRTSEGRGLAKAKGVVMGRRPNLTDHQRREAVRMVRDEGKSLRDVAKHFNVSHLGVARLT